MKLIRRRYLAAALCLAVLAAVALPFAGCKKDELAFSGLSGRMSPGPLANTLITVYDGSLFLGHGAGKPGRLGNVRVDADGRFLLPLPDSSIGRTLIVVADFPANDPLTAADDRTSYVDYEGTGNLIVMDPADGPWYSIVDFFSGLTVTVNVSPITTAAFYSLQSLPEAEVGVGPARYTQFNAQRTLRALGTSFGLAADPSRTLPAQPALGGGHAAPKSSESERTSDSGALAYALIQLERTASAFSAAVGSIGNDRQSFYAGLFNDARDGVLDGQVNGVPVPQFVAPGAPPIIGLDTDGRSLVMQYISQTGIVTPDVEAKILTAATRIFPLPINIREAQNASTGGCRSVTITDVDAQFLPRSGGIDLTVRGHGFTRDWSAVFASDPLAITFATGSLKRVSAAELGDKGQLLSIQHDRAVFRMPNFRAAGTPAAFALSTVTQDRKINLFLRFDYDSTREATGFDHHAATLTLFQDSGLHVIDARARLVDGTAGTDAEVPATTSITPTGTDPGTFDSNLQPTFGLALRVYNGTATTLDGVTLDAAATTAKRLSNGAAVPLAAYAGAGGTGTPIVLPAAGSLATATVQPATSATLFIPLTFDAALVAANPSLGASVMLSPVCHGAPAGGGAALLSNANPSLPQASTTFAPVAADETPALSTTAAPAGLTLTGTAESLVTWELSLAGVASATSRAIRVDSLEVAMTRGTETRGVVITGPATVLPDLGFGVLLSSLTFDSQPGDTTLPLHPVTGPVTLTLGFTPRGLSTPPGSITLTLRCSDPATGARSAQTLTLPVTFIP